MFLHVFAHFYHSNLRKSQTNNKYNNFLLALFKKITTIFSITKEENMDLFDLTDLTEIPDTLKQDLVKDEFAERLMMLLNKAERPLNFDELTVGYYRLFCKDSNEELKTKKQIMTKIYNMSRGRNSRIEAVPHKKGLYRLKEIVDA